MVDLSSERRYVAFQLVMLVHLLRGAHAHGRAHEGDV